MSGKLVLTVEEVPAVAGKVNIHLEREEVKVRVDFGAVQEPRFFERFLRGRPVTQAPWVMSRICGVCSVVHLVCSIEAAERALGVEPKPEVRALREVAKGVEILQNNLLHVLMSLPDFMGHDNVVELSKGHPKLFSKLMSINASILEVSRRLFGRFVHIPSLGVATQGKPVSRHELEAAGKLLRQIYSDLLEAADLLSGVWKPIADGFKDPAPTYCVLKPREREYPFFSDELLFSDGGTVGAARYFEAIEEFVAPASNAHYTLYKGSPFYVGSRARLQAYASILPRKALELEGTLAINYSNPFDNVKAQYVEVACLADVLADMLGELASRTRRGVEPYVLKECPPVNGEGVGLATAPRGVLIHHYKVVSGRLEQANIITPTVMNARHIEVTGESLARWARDDGVEDEARIRRLLEALVRSYDPCLPCAVH